MENRLYPWVDIGGGEDSGEMIMLLASYYTETWHGYIYVL